MDFNFHNNALLTTSEDGRACVWKYGKVDSQVLTISHLFRNPASGKTNTKNRSLSTNISNGRFYYMDKFILLVLLAYKSRVIFFVERERCNFNVYI